MVPAGQEVLRLAVIQIKMEILEQTAEPIILMVSAEHLFGIILAKVETADMSTQKQKLEPMAAFI